MGLWDLTRNCATGIGTIRGRRVHKTHINTCLGEFLDTNAIEPVSNEKNCKQGYCIRQCTVHTNTSIFSYITNFIGKIGTSD